MLEHTVHQLLGFIELSILVDLGIALFLLHMLGFFYSEF